MGSLASRHAFIGMPNAYVIIQNTWLGGKACFTSFCLVGDMVTCLAEITTAIYHNTMTYQSIIIAFVVRGVFFIIEPGLLALR